MKIKIGTVDCNTGLVFAGSGKKPTKEMLKQERKIKRAEKRK
jgi:hypothetical protein